MVNRGFGPDDRRQKDAQDGVTQEHASADVEMINTEFDPTQGTTIAESNTARELSKINMRLDQQREDIDENNAMIAYIGNAQYTFESTLDRFEDQLDDHCLNCNQKPEKISDNSNELSFTARVKVARSLHQNKGQIRALQMK